MEPLPLSKLIDSFHPEAQEDGIFVGNIRDESGINSYGWQTKRLGQQAYDMANKPISGLPVFVKRSEVEKVTLTTYELALLNVVIQPIMNN